MADLSDDPTTRTLIGAAIEVHKHLGPGLLESAYELCLAHELRERGLKVDTQVKLPVTYKGVDLACSYKLDLVVEARIIIEVKSVQQLLPVHEAQLLTYLKLSGMALGLLINFHVPVLRSGIKRLIL
jgi:GxxExxY protein